MKVIVTGGYGAGFSSWCNKVDPCDLTLISLVEGGEWDHAITYCVAKWGQDYYEGLRGSVVEEVPKGSLFRIDEYDGYEHIEIFDPQDWRQAT